MRKALNITELSEVLGLTRRGGHERIKGDYRGGVQMVILPFDSKIKKQKARNVRYLKDWIVSPDADGNLCTLSPCELIPVRTGGDVEFEYWNEKCRYKIPEGAFFLTRQHGK